MTATTATIEVASEPKEATLSIGDVRRFEVTGDDYYDISVTLESIVDGKAKVTIKPNNELVTVETEAEEKAKEDVAKEQKEAEQGDKLWTYSIIGIVIILIVVVVIVVRKRR